jgi:hypothetical protein
LEDTIAKEVFLAFELLMSMTKGVYSLILHSTS